MTRKSSAYNPKKKKELERECEDLDIALFSDNRDEFVRLIRSPRLDEWPHLDLNDIARSIIKRKAVRCAGAVLCGETDGIIDPHFGFDPNGWTALHEASSDIDEVYDYMDDEEEASDHSDIDDTNMVKFLLEAGFSADVRGSPYENDNKTADLPLNVALKLLRSRYVCLDSHEMSAANLLNHIFPKRCILDSIRLLALNTKELEFKREFFFYAKDGFLVEVGALLLAAGEKLMPLCIRKGEDFFVVNSFKELGNILQDNLRLTTTRDDIIAEWKETMKLLDRYDKIGNQLTAYAGLKENRPSGTEFATLLETAGFHVTIGDNNLDYANRSYTASVIPIVPQVTYYEQDSDMNFPGWINKMSQEASKPTGHKSYTSCIGTMPSNPSTTMTPLLKSVNSKQSQPTGHSYHTSSWVEALALKPATPVTPPLKLVNSTQSLGSRKFLGLVARILPRVVRRV